MKQIIFCLALMLSIRCFGAGLSVSTSNGTAYGLSLLGQVTNTPLATAAKTNLIGVAPDGKQKIVSLGTGFQLSGAGVLSTSVTNGGETNTASNVGGGVPGFKGKVGVDFRFATFTNTDGKIALSTNSNSNVVANLTFDPATNGSGSGSVSPGANINTNGGLVGLNPSLTNLHDVFMTNGIVKTNFQVTSLSLTMPLHLDGDLIDIVAIAEGLTLDLSGGNSRNTTFIKVDQGNGTITNCTISFSGEDAFGKISLTSGGGVDVSNVVIDVASDFGTKFITCNESSIGRIADTGHGLSSVTVDHSDNFWLLGVQSKRATFCDFHLDRCSHIKIIGDDYSRVSGTIVGVTNLTNSVPTGVWRDFHTNGTWTDLADTNGGITVSSITLDGDTRTNWPSGGISTNFQVDEWVLITNNAVRSLLVSNTVTHYPFTYFTNGNASFPVDLGITRDTYFGTFSDYIKNDGTFSFGNGMMTGDSSAAYMGAHRIKWTVRDFNDPQTTIIDGALNAILTIGADADDFGEDTTQPGVALWYSFDSAVAAFLQAGGVYQSTEFVRLVSGGGDNQILNYYFNTNNTAHMTIAGGAQELLVEAPIYGNLIGGTNLPITGIQTNGGTAGQILTRTATSLAWSNAPAGGVGDSTGWSTNKAVSSVNLAGNLVSNGNTITVTGAISGSTLNYTTSPTASSTSLPILSKNGDQIVTLNNTHINNSTFDKPDLWVVEPSGDYNVTWHNSTTNVGQSGYVLTWVSTNIGAWLPTSSSSSDVSNYPPVGIWTNLDFRTTTKLFTNKVADTVYFHATANLDSSGGSDLLTAQYSFGGLPSVTFAISQNGFTAVGAGVGSFSCFLPTNGVVSIINGDSGSGDDTALLDGFYQIIK